MLSEEDWGDESDGDAAAVEEEEEECQMKTKRIKELPRRSRIRAVPVLQLMDLVMGVVVLRPAWQQQPWLSE
jgi:hypothetical protein